MNALLTQLALAAIPAILAITLHEAAHGYAALALGDDTARRAGRLNLNPIRHIDPFGTLLLPGFLLVSQWLTIGRVEFMFGWAKPVPVGAARFRNPRRGVALVAAAGPATNFGLAWLGALAWHGLGWLPGAGQQPAADFLQYFMLSNLVLGLFNLIPIPPLDGGRIAVGLLPWPLARRWAALERGGIAIVLILMFLLPRLLQGVGFGFDPLQHGLAGLVDAGLGVVRFLAFWGRNDAGGP